MEYFVTYTSSLPIELSEIKKEEYNESFKKAKDDWDIQMMSEEGIDDFLEIISK